MLNYLAGARKQFLYYKSLADKTFDQVSDEALFWQHDADSNSIAMMVQHLAGNMLSRFTDFLESDGEKPWRNRESEFEPVLQTRAEMLAYWEKGWTCLMTALDALTDADLDRMVYIRNQGHTVLEAINRQLCHYPYHIGQIVFAGKMLCAGDWQSLSIPKGGSAAFNAEKFARDKKPGHFTDK